MMQDDPDFVNIYDDQPLTLTEFVEFATCDSTGTAYLTAYMDSSSFTANPVSYTMPGNQYDYYVNTFVFPDLVPVSAGLTDFQSISLVVLRYY
jgi:hypothetical protein